MNTKNLKPGDEVFWTDPNDGIGSGIYVIHEIVSSEVLIITTPEYDSYIEVFAHELS